MPPVPGKPPAKPPATASVYCERAVWAYRGRAVWVLPIAVLLSGCLSGCGGYFSGQWPNLAEGFEDAAERDAALAAVNQLVDEKAGALAAEPQAQVQAPDSDPDPDPYPDPVPPEAPRTPEPLISSQALAALRLELDDAVSAIASARQAYEDAKAAFTEGAEDRARGRWLTAQMKLTGLNRAAGGLDPVHRKLQPAARQCRAQDSRPVCKLARRASDAADDLAAYLAGERQFLIAETPAGPS